MKKTLYFSIGLVSLVLGLMIALQFRTVGQVDSAVPSDRAQLLTNQLKEIEKETVTLLIEANDLENKLTRAEKGQNEASEAVLEELQKVRQIAGFTQLKGSGVEVYIAPVQRAGQHNENNWYVVSDEDLLLRVVNELRAAGAEALSINGQRIISTSEIRLAGSFIDVNLTRISPPYTIMAIGAPDQLESSLLIKGGLVDSIRDWEVTVTKQEELLLPAYKHNVKLEYAKPLKEAK